MGGSGGQIASSAATDTGSVLRGRAAVEFVRSSWPERTPTEFVSAGWILSAWKFLPELGSPAVAVAADGADWGAVALTERTGPGGSRVLLAGAPLGDEHDVVCSGRRPTAAMMRKLVGTLRGEVRAGAVMEVDCLLPEGHLARALADDALTWSLEPEPAPVIRCAALTVDPRRHAKRLGRLRRAGDVTFGVIDGERLGVAVGQSFVERRLASWSARQRVLELPSIERSAAFPRFFGEAVHWMAVRGNARLHVLRVGDRAVAEDLMLGPAGDPLLYMRHYEPEFATYSPGRILLEHTLLAMARADTARLRTGRGDEGYKIAAGADDSCVITASSR